MAQLDTKAFIILLIGACVIAAFCIFFPTIQEMMGLIWGGSFP